MGLGMYVSSQRCVCRLRGVIDGLQRDRRVGERETGDDFTLAAELRWKINQLEKDKLDFTSKHNEEVQTNTCSASDRCLNM